MWKIKFEKVNSVNFSVISDAKNAIVFVDKPQMKIMSFKKHDQHDTWSNKAFNDTVVNSILLNEDHLKIRLQSF